MNATDLLNSEIMKLPIIYNSDNGYFPEMMKLKFKLYLKEIQSLDYKIPFFKSIQDKYSKIETLVLSINNAIEKYYSGFPADAYDSLKEGLSNIRDEFRVIQQASLLVDSNIFYRMRLSDNQLDSYKDLFHIPFELRENKVTSQRYSISGLPCLYLGSSVYICWEELDKPSHDKCYISKLHDNKSELIDRYYKVDNIINFGNRPDVQSLYFNKYVNDNVDITKEYAINNT